MSDSHTPSEHGFHAQLSEKLMSLFNTVVEERQTYYQKNATAIPDPSDIRNLIAKYSNQNALISGGLSLVPGPWGMLAAVPEIALVVRYQLMLIYDIGMAYGQSKVLTKELIAGVFASSLGIGGIGLLTIHGGKVLVRRTSLRVFQRMISLLGGKITQQLLRSQISKWLPGVGAAAMAAWSKYSTSQVGKKAAELLSRPIEIVPDEPNTDDIPHEKSETNGTINSLKLLKITALINLMKADGKIAQQELDYLETLITNAALDAATVSHVREQMTAEGKIPIDYTAFTSNPDDSLGLMIDLIALARRDGEFHITEKMYIKHIGRIVGYAEADISTMIEG